MNQVVNQLVQREAVRAQPIVDVQRRVLCAIDLSSQSDRTMRRAMYIAQETAAELLLFHSIAPARTERLTRRKRVRAHVLLDARARGIFPSGGVPQIAVRVGGYQNAIVEMAREWNADLIVVGSHRPRLGDSVVGTTAERVIRKAHRPIVVVNHDARRPYENVLLTADLSDVSAGAAQVAQDLGLLENGVAAIVHALTPSASSMLRISGVSKTTLESYEREFRSWTAEEIEGQFKKIGLRTDRMALVAEQGSPVGVIERASQLTSADLVVVGASRFPALKRVILGSVSNELLRTLNCDVLLVSPGAVKRSIAATREHFRLRDSTSCTARLGLA